MIEARDLAPAPADSEAPSPLAYLREIEPPGASLTRTPGPEPRVRELCVFRLFILKVNGPSPLRD